MEASIRIGDFLRRLASGEQQAVSLLPWRWSHADRGEAPRQFAAGRSQLALGFTLIELMVVITIVLILISIAAPIYRNSIIRSKEAVLHDDLFTLRSLIDEYTLDKQAAPQSLQDLVDQGYIRQLPTDPFTAANNTWVEVTEDAILMTPDQKMPGIIDVHSGSNLKSLAGDLYSSW